jgi:mannose-6-phosphate isomerase-like protein (cupin superfamily)
MSGTSNKYLVGKVSPIDTPNFTMNVLEFYKQIPSFPDFSPKRVYWITNIKGKKESGQHAHKDGEDELFVIIQGKIKMILDDGSGKKTIDLKTNDTIWVPRYVWHGFIKMSKDCIILALTSTIYDPERKGYVTDPAEFAKLSSQ